MDVKFSSALHMLVLISESEKNMTSEEIALSVGTNASYIRKIAGYLKKANIIESNRGITGFKLKKKRSEINFLEIYKAVSEKENISLFDIHCNPNDVCIVGKYIKPSLNELFYSINSEIEKSLKNRTLEDCIKNIKEKIEK